MSCPSVERPPVASSWASDKSSSPPPYELYDIYPSIHVPAANGLPNGTPRPTPRTPDLRSGVSGTTQKTTPSNVLIPHLREALTSLDSRMATLLSERDILESRLEQAVRMQSPVQRLPSELLASIFTRGVLGTEEEDSLMLSNLMLVCRYWKDVAINTPVLWSRIAAGTRHSLGKAKRKLERSKSVPLHICVDFSPRVHNGNVPTECIILAMDLLQTSIWRWKSFHLTIPNRSQAQFALARCSEEAPLLEVLSIRILHSMQEDHYPQRVSPLLFEGRTPSLRSCSFTSFNFNWDMKLLSRLRVLKLGGYWNGFSPSVDTILGILKACPSLEEFSLRNMSDVDPDSKPSAGLLEYHPPRQSDTRMIHLPRLAKLTFHCAGIARTRAVMDAISFPALETIELSFLDNVSPIIEHLFQQSLTLLPLRRIRIESSLFNDLRLVNKLLRKLSSITTLELVDCEDASSELLKTLSITRPWICPKLTSVSLEGSSAFGWEALRSFVESRLPAHARAYPRQMSSTPAPPPVLSSASGNLMPSTRTTSSASAFAAKAHILTPAHVSASNQNVNWPLRLQSIDLTRCPQVSKEMVQWLRMYVSEVRCETAVGVWGDSSTV